MEEVGYEFKIVEPHTEELHTGKPEDLVVENARRKALSVECGEDEIVIGADTIGICNGELLGKPADENDARRMLLLQQDHPCMVITGLVVLDCKRNRTLHGYERSVVVMEGGREGVEKYLKTGQWKGKAGSFGLQDRGPIGARVVEGEEDNMIGMPITLLRRLLSLIGYEYPVRTPSGII
jgi:septum formation protein